MTENVDVVAEKENPTYITVDRHDPKIMDALQNAPIYKKQGEVTAIFAKGGEKIQTKLSDGSVETDNTAKEGEEVGLGLGVMVGVDEGVGKSVGVEVGVEVGVDVDRAGVIVGG